MGPEQVLLLRVRMDLRIMLLKVHATFSKGVTLKPHHQMQFRVIFRTLICCGGGGGVLTSLLRYSLCIPQLCQAVSATVI